MKMLYIRQLDSQNFDLNKNLKITIMSFAGVRKATFGRFIFVDSGILYENETGIYFS